MAEKWVSKKKAFSELGKIGFVRAWQSSKSILSGRGILSKDLTLIKRAAKRLGTENLKSFLDQIPNTTAARQLRTPVGNRKKPSEPEITLFILRKFLQPIGRITNNPKLKKYGFKPVLRTRAERELTMALELYTSKKEYVAIFNFDLRLNSKKEGVAVLGNMQGASRQAVADFKEKIGIPAKFFVQVFSKAFPGKRLLGLNVKYHGYRKPDDLEISKKMESSGKITHKEYLSRWYTDGENFNPAARKKVQELIDAEKRKIITRVTGMHKAAYKGIGLNIRGKSRYYRRK